MSKDGFHFLDAFVVTSFSQLLPQGFYLDLSLLLDGLVYNHTVVKEGLTSESLIPLEMIVNENAEAGIDHEGAAKGKIEDNADHEAAAKQKIEDNADHEAAAKEKIEENAGIGLQVLLTPKERRSPGLLLRSEEDKEPEQEGVSEVEGGSGSKESVTDAPPAIDDAVKILDTWKNKKFGDGVVAELAKLASTDGMAPGDEIRSTLKEIMTCVVQHIGLRTTFVVEEGFDGFHIQSNDRSLPKKPISFNIHTPGEGAMIGKFLHNMRELIGWYNFIIGEEHLSMLIVPRIPSTPVMEEFKTWGESDVFMLDPLTTKATTIAPKFKTLLR